MKVGALFVVLLAGCASLGSDINVAKDSWHGATYDAVVSRWGTPVRSTTLADGREARTWVSEEAVSGGTYFPSIGVYGGSGGIGVGTSVVMGLPGMGAGGGGQVRCERTLFFRDQRVVDQLWQGSAGYCSTFQRK
jgi:uncharacterized membrane protein